MSSSSSLPRKANKQQNRTSILLTFQNSQNWKEEVARAKWIRSTFEKALTQGQTLMSGQVSPSKGRPGGWEVKVFTSAGEEDTGADAKIKKWRKNLYQMMSSALFPPRQITDESYSFHKNLNKQGEEFLTGLNEIWPRYHSQENMKTDFFKLIREIVAMRGTIHTLALKRKDVADEITEAVHQIAEDIDENTIATIMALRQNRLSRPCGRLERTAAERNER